MTTDELLQLFTGEKAYRQLAAEIRPGRSVGLASLAGSSLSLVAAAAVRQTGGLHVFVMELFMMMSNWSFAFWYSPLAK